jgi:cytochrome b involved in lipid metabolism
MPRALTRFFLAACSSRRTSRAQGPRSALKTAADHHPHYRHKMLDTNPGAVVSSDHADPSLSADLLISSAPTKKKKLAPRLISADEIKQHNGRNGESFWAVVDGFVVDATEFVADGGHPGGLKKLLSTDAAGTGATGKPFGFSFSRGRNAHFPQTGQRFQEGAKRFLSGVSESEANLPPVEVAFPPYGKIVILGRLEA